MLRYDLQVHSLIEVGLQNKAVRTVIYQVFNRMVINNGSKLWFQIALIIDGLCGFGSTNTISDFMKSCLKNLQKSACCVYSLAICVAGQYLRGYGGFSAGLCTACPLHCTTTLVLLMGFCVLQPPSVYLLSIHSSNSKIACFQRFTFLLFDTFVEEKGCLLWRYYFF